jgi:hypothetical protein
MQTLKRIFNPSAWRQWAVVFLAGLVVLTTTACGSTQAAVPPSNGSGSVNSPKSEGMYPHKDTDMDTSGADAKADRMIRQAEQRIQKNIDKPLSQRYGEAGQEVGQSAKEAVKNIGKSTQRAADNAAENARGMGNGAAETVDRLAPNQPNS